MGCCVSIPNPTGNQQETSAHKHPLHSISKSPPTPSSDDESVKEVLLSETSTLHNHHQPHNKINGADSMLHFNPTGKNQTFEKPRCEFKSPRAAAAAVQTSEDISDLSEIYNSLGESFDKREHAITAAGQRVNRSPAKGSTKGSFSGDLGRLRNEDNGSYAAGRSPARRSANPSPRRRNEDCVRRGLGLVDGQVRWDSTDNNSGRRSRSPGTRVEVPGGGVGRRGNMGRRNGPSPGRIRMAQQADNNNNNNGNGRREENGSAGRWATHPNESLENPLVSLECFIFL